MVASRTKTGGVEYSLKETRWSFKRHHDVYESKGYVVSNDTNKRVLTLFIQNEKMPGGFHLGKVILPYDYIRRLRLKFLKPGIVTRLPLELRYKKRASLDGIHSDFIDVRLI